MSHKNVFSFQEEGAQLQASFHTVQDKRGGNVNKSASWVVSGQALKATKNSTTLTKRAPLGNGLRVHLANIHYIEVNK